MTEQYKPEIGEECEVFRISEVLGNRWVKVKCVGHDANGIIWRNGSDTRSYLYAELKNVRKYKSDYTMYEEDLTAIFDNNPYIPYHLNNTDYQTVIKSLWANGYRKKEY